MYWKAELALRYILRQIVTNIELLSGGEKALVAIALYFAIMKVSPPPFCILDEIEAALDDVNVSRFASYLRKMNDNTQFVTITHRRGTHGRSGRFIRRYHAGPGGIEIVRAGCKRN